VAFDFLGVMTQTMWDEYIKFVDNIIEDVVSDDCSDDPGKAIACQIKKESERLLKYFKDLVRADKFMQGDMGKQRIGDRSMMFANEDREQLFSEDIETCVYEKYKEVLGMGSQEDSRSCFFNEKIRSLANKHIIRRRENLEFQIKRCVDRIESLFTKYETLTRREGLLDDFKKNINDMFADEVNYFTCVSKDDDLYTDRGIMLGRKSPSESRGTDSSGAASGALAGVEAGFSSGLKL